MGDLAIVAWMSWQDPGAAYIFDMETGNLVFEIREPQEGDRAFAQDVATWGGNLFVTAPNQASGVPGVVYLFEVVPVPEPAAIVPAAVALIGFFVYATTRRRTRADTHAEAV